MKEYSERISTYAKLNLPEAWKPLFRSLETAGWSLGGSFQAEEWTSRPVLVFGDGTGRNRYLSFLTEPIWCGNTRQAAGLTIAAISHHAPHGREEAEQHSISLSGNWEAEIEDFLAEAL